MAELIHPLGNDLAGRYVLERELGRGGMATVYLARDLRHDRPVALKVLRPELAGALGADRFLREIAFTARLDHPNILPVFDSGTANGLLWYTMPFVDGESLRDRLRREGQLSVEEAVRLACEVADALEYAHGRGIVHRDVKPENILLSGSPREGSVEGREPPERVHARVADFGVARAMEAAAGERLTSTGLALGTPAYMAPEQASEGGADARADVYALACVVYEMLAGEPPYTGPSAHAIIAKRFADPIPSLRRLRDGVSERLDAVVRRGLARSPADRYAGAAEFERALRDALRAAPGAEFTTPGMSTPAPSIPARASWTRRRIGVLAIAVAVVALVAGVARRLTSAKVTGPERVAVYPFANRTGDGALNSLGSLSADWIAQAVSRVPSVQLVTMPALMVDTLAKPLDLGRAASAHTVVWGSIYRVRDSLRLVANVTDVAAGDLLATVEVAAPGAAPEAGIQALAERVTTSILVTRSKDTTEMLMRSTRPPTFAAFQAFAEGMEWNDSSALSAFERAAALDTAFLSPLVWIGFIHRNRGDYALADSVGSIAERRRDRLGPFERAALDRMLAEVRGSNEEAFLASRRVLAAAPGSDWAKCVTAEAALWINRPHAALRTLEGVETRPGVYNGAEWCDLVPFEAWMMLDDGEHALAAARHFRQKWSESPWAPEGRDMEAMALARLGRLAEARVLADSVPPQSYLILLLGHEFRSKGDAATARALFERKAAMLKDATDTSARAALGEALYWGGRRDEAAAIFRGLLGHPKLGVRAHGALGVLAARREDRTEARAEDDWLASVDLRHRRGEVSVWRARIAAALGERERAVELLERAFREGQTRDYFGMYGPGMAWFRQDPHFESLRELPAYAALMRPRE